MNNASRDLLERATRFGLISRDDFEQVFSTMSQAPSAGPLSNGRSGSSADVAKQLQSRGLLTPFQAKAVACDRLEDLIFGPYVVEAELGQGGMGRVLRAKHPLLKRTVAIKTIRADLFKNDEAVQRFLREVQVIGQISHPNVVAAHHADRRDDEYYLVMEFIEGTTFFDLVKTFGVMSLPQSRTCIIGAARGLHYAHSQNIIHRDIKPDNLMLTKDKVVKVLDLGLARIATADAPAMTDPGAVMGTFDYMAPEQWEDSRHVDARTDIYSLGCSLYFLCVGRHIFADQRTLPSKMMAHVHTPSPSMLPSRPDLPRRLDAIYRKMTAKRPEDRFATMNDVIYALSQDLSGVSDAIPKQVAVPKSFGGADLPPTPPPPRTPPPPLELELDLELPNTPPRLPDSGSGAGSGSGLGSGSKPKSHSKLKTQPQPVIQAVEIVAPKPGVGKSEDEIEAGDGGNHRVRLAHLRLERWIGAAGGVTAACGLFWIGFIGQFALQESRRAASGSDWIASLIAFLFLSSFGAGLVPIGIGLAFGSVVARAFALMVWILTIICCAVLAIFHIGFSEASWSFRLSAITIASLLAIAFTIASYSVLSQKGRRIFSKPYRQTRRRTSEIAVGGGVVMFVAMLATLAIFGVLAFSLG